MKTNKNISRVTLNTAFSDINDVEHLTNELYLIIINNETLYNDLVKNKRAKSHSIAFRSLWELVKVVGIKNGYYVSSAQMKSFLLEKYKLDYKEVLSNLILKLELYRKDNMK